MDFIIDLAFLLSEPSFPPCLPYGILKEVGKKQAIPHQAAGIFKEPPLSEPMPISEALA